MTNINNIVVTDAEIKAEMKNSAKQTKNLAKGLTYAVNYLARPIGNSLKEGLNLGNPWGAITYGLTDMLNVADKPLTNAINTTVKTLGGLYYAGCTLRDLVGIAQGDTEHLASLPFNASMLYTSVKDSKLDIKGAVNNYKKFFTNTKKLFGKNN